MTTKINLRDILISPEAHVTAPETVQVPDQRDTITERKHAALPDLEPATDDYDQAVKSLKRRHPHIHRRLSSFD